MSKVEENESSKCRRLEESEQSFAVTDLPDVLLKACFSFVGPGNYYFIGTTCKRFKKVYPYRKRTTWKSAVASACCFQACIGDVVTSGAVAKEDALRILLRSAATTGSIPGLEEIRSRYGRRCNKKDLVSAGIRGDLKLLVWAERNRTSWYTEALCKNAARNGHVDMLKWIYDKERRLSNQCAEAAAKGGCLDVLKWLQQNRLLAPEYEHGYMWEVAAKYGHFHVLEWLYENSVPSMSCAAIGAAASGRIDVLEWSQEHGLVFEHGGLPCSHAAQYGHLGTLKWLRQNGCPWDSETIYCAKTQEIAKWARDNGCPTRRVFDNGRSFDV